LNPQPVKRRVPVSHHVLAVTFGAILTITAALSVAASNPGDFWLAASISALCAAYPSISLGIRIFVTNHTIVRDSRGEESVEMAWMRQAASGAFLDVLVTTVLGCVALAITRLQIPALPALLALVALSCIDAGLRYWLVRYRALR